VSRPPLTLRLCRRVLGAASWLVPHAQRSAWRREWEAEVAHRWQLLGRRRAGTAARLDLLRRVAGSLSDAAWLRRQLTSDSELVRDLRHGARLLRRQPAFVTGVVAVLALGIGSATAVFALVDALLMRPLPYAEVDRLMTLWGSNPSADEARDDVAPGDFLDWKERSRSFESMAAAIPSSYDYTGGTTPEVFFAVRVTEGFFGVMRIAPLIGRDFLPEEHRHGREKVVLLDHGLWVRRFGGDPSIVGQNLSLENEPYTVVGVLPPEFEPGVLPTSGPRGIWTPHVVEDHERRIRGSAWWAVVARLRTGTTREQAQAEMDAIAASLEKEHPRTNRDVRVTVLPFADHLTAVLRRPLLLLSGASALLLLLAAANLVGLFLARGVERQHELAVRASLGAHRARLVRQLVGEALLLGALGSVLGLLLGRWAVDALVALSPVNVPRLGQVQLGVRGLLFGTAASLATALVCGTVSALAASRATGGERMHESSRTRGGLQRQPLRRAMVVAQVATALVLLFGAGLLARSFGRLVRTDPGFQRDGVAVLQVFAWDRNPTPAKQAAFFEDTLARIEALPGVTAAGVVSRMPFIEANIGIRSPLTVEGRPVAAPGHEGSAFLTVASRGYFGAMGIPVTSGRGFTESDRLNGAPVVVVNETLARRQWPGESPVGSRVGMRWRGRPMTAEVVGVVGAARHRRLDGEADPELFMSAEQVPYGSMTYVVRTSRGAAALIPAVQRAVWSADPQQAFYRTATLDELVSKSLSSRRFLLLVLAAFAAVALALAATGLYALVSFLAAQRTQEIGVRVALGARGADIFRLVAGEGLTLVGGGLLLGAAGALAAGRVLESALFGISPFDPGTALLVVGVLGTVAFGACAVPAGRALRLDPVEALRND
jgi:putative ABC transport system permease protein